MSCGMDIIYTVWQENCLGNSWNRRKSFGFSPKTPNLSQLSEFKQRRISIIEDVKKCRLNGVDRDALRTVGYIPLHWLVNQGCLELAFVIHRTGLL